MFFDGVRVNEPFGDVVNWDLIPLNAVERFDLFPGSNPLFGLNTLGGAISSVPAVGSRRPVSTRKSPRGSWQRKQGRPPSARTTARWVASPRFSTSMKTAGATIRRRRFGRSFCVATGAARKVYSPRRHSSRTTSSQATASSPTICIARAGESVFTSPDETQNTLKQFALSGALDVSDSLNITAQVYRRDSDRDGLNGDIYEGFDDFSVARDVSRTGLRKDNPNLPWCRAREPGRHGDDQLGREPAHQRSARHELHVRALRERSAS